MKQVTLVCDGSSLNNGRGNPRAAAVAILDYQGKRRIIGEYLGSATNQVAEIVAAAIGLENLKEPCKVTVISDSQYVVRTMKGEFKRKANLDWWSRLDRAAKPHKVNWTWTRGHAGHPIQEACDTAARNIAMSGVVDQPALDEILTAVEQ
ncbi:MAG TPA: RNase H family protein [Blastocatellia bacterium]|nr:RNase H family protein [Blastocatellia bacterium]